MHGRTLKRHAPWAAALAALITVVTAAPAHAAVATISFNPLAGEFPEGIAFDDRGSLYVTDSLQGAVWRLNPNAPPERLVQDPLLEGDGSFGIGVPLGANGIAFRHGSLWVTNTELGRVVRIQLSSTGTAGAVQLVAESPQLIGSDGCQFD